MRLFHSINMKEGQVFSVTVLIIFDPQPASHFNYLSEQSNCDNPDHNSDNIAIIAFDARNEGRGIFLSKVLNYINLKILLLTSIVQLLFTHRRNSI